MVLESCSKIVRLKQPIPTLDTTMRIFYLQIMGFVVFLCVSYAGFAEEVDKYRETSTTLEVIDGELSFYIAPKRVQAGSYPELVGEVFLPRTQRYPGLLKLKDEVSLRVAKDLENIDGDNRWISSFLPGSCDAIRGYR